MDKTHGESVPQDVPLTSQVLEYYRNFSQNNELPRYLCGDITANVHTSPEPEYNYQILKVREDESVTTETGGTSQIFTVNVAPRPPLIGQDHAVPVITVCDANHDNGRNVSPTSSVTSNRKLEWDNGADIGYENCEVANRSLQKSSSLPTLNTLERDLRKDFQRQSPDGKIADTSQKIPIKLANKSSDTSTDTLNQALKQLTPSTSTITSSNDAKTQKSLSNSTSSALTKCTPSTSSTSNSSNVYITQSKLVYMPAVVITSPLAESTPIYSKSSEETCQTEDYFATPIITHPKKPPRKNPISSIPENEEKRKKKSIFTRSNSLEIIPNLDETLEQRNKYFNRYKKDKIQKLGVTKTISVECFGKVENDNISVGIQTEREKQQLVFIKQYQSDDKENSPSSSSDSSKNIDLNCNSFEYLYGGAIHPENQPLRTENIEPLKSFKELPKVSDDNSVKSCDRQEIVENYIISSNLKRSQAKSDLTNVTALTSTLSTNTTRTTTISSKESNNLIPDVDKSIEILQKLLKTKKYDEATKKYYLKKIVKKLVESKYFDDTQSTAGESTDKPSTSKSSDNSNITQEKSLYPQANSISPNPKYLKQLTRQTFAAEIPPQITAEEQSTTTGNKRQVKSQTSLKDKIDIYPRIQRNPRFTLTNSEFYVSHNYQPKENLSPSENTSSDLFRPHSRIVFPSCTTDSSLEKSGHCSVNKTSTSTDSRSWREDKTLSEKLLEDKNIRDMSGDFIRQDNDILQFAKRERATQLNWINNEITHLSKLKTLLEKKDGFNEQLDSQGIKPKKSTAVYMITTDPDNKSIDAPRNRKRNPLNIPNVIKAERKENQFKFKVQHGQELRDYNLREIKNDCTNSGKCSHKNCPYSSTSVPLTRFVSSSSAPSSSYSPKNTNSDDISENDTNNVCKMCSNSLKYKYQGSRSENKQVRWTCNDCNGCLKDKSEVVTKDSPKKDYSLPKSSSAPNSPTSKSRNRCSTVSNPQTETSQGFSTTPPVEFSSQDIFRIPTELQSAKLISSEIYTSAECPTTSIRRYVFEIPILDLHKNEKGFKESESTVSGRFIRPAERDFEVRTSLVETDGKEEDVVPESRNNLGSDRVRPDNEEISQGKTRRSDYDKVGPTTSEEIPRTSRKREDIEKVPTKRDNEKNEQIPQASRKDNYNEKISPRISPITDQFSRDSRKENDSEKISRPLKEQFSQTSRKVDDNEKISPINEQFSRANKKNNDNYNEKISPRISPEPEKMSRAIRKSDDYEKISPRISPITEPIIGASKKLNDVNLSPGNIVDEVESNVVYKDLRSYTVPRNSVATQQSLLKDKYSETTSSKTSSIGTMTNSSDRLTGRNIDVISLEQNVQSLSKPEKETITSKDSAVSKDTQTNDDTKKRDKNSKALQTGDSLLSSTPPKKSSKTSSSNSKSTDTTVSSSYSSSSDSTNSYRLCQCCRKSKISVTEDKFFFNENIHHPLCQPCYLTNQHTLIRNSQPYYNHPKHICNCYTMIKTQHVQDIKNTIQQLRALETDQSYCKCSKKSGKKDNNTCGRCNCKLRKEKVKKKALAYLLKFERGDEGKTEESEKKSQSLEEIVVKIPHSPRNRKLTEDSEKENDESAKKKHHKTKKNEKNEKKVKKSSKTLQEYLSTNRPNFIESAEQRRKCLIELAYMREERCQKYKQLLAMTSGVPVMQNLLQNNIPKPKPRVFSTNEMKRITAKNYKKLPEVQQKLLDNRDKQIKKANRLLSDIFNKKLRDNVLKGNPTLSTSVSVINLA